jgi:hypothetical protein
MKHIALMVATLDLGLIAMIAVLRWLIGTQRSAKHHERRCGSYRSRLSHADHVQE